MTHPAGAVEIDRLTERVKELEAALDTAIYALREVESDTFYEFDSDLTPEADRLISRLERARHKGPPPMTGDGYQPRTRERLIEILSAQDENPRSWQREAAALLTTPSPVGVDGMREALEKARETFFIMLSGAPVATPLRGREKAVFDLARQAFEDASTALASAPHGELATSGGSANRNASPSTRTNEQVLGEQLEAEELEMFRLADRLGYVCLPEPQHPDSPHAQEMIERVAAEVHKGRFPDDREPNPFDTEDDRGREYCLRIARRVIASGLLTTPAPSPAGVPDGWHRIDDPTYPAPKDETPIDLWRPKATHGRWQQRVTARWVGVFGGEEINDFLWPDDPTVDVADDDAFFKAVQDGDTYEGRGSFTHWRPLPDPPSEVKP